MKIIYEHIEDQDQAGLGFGFCFGLGFGRGRVVKCAALDLVLHNQSIQ